VEPLAQPEVTLPDAMFPKPRKVRVHTSWFKLRPEKGRNADFWFAVAVLAKKRGVASSNLQKILKLSWEIK